MTLLKAFRSLQNVLQKGNCSGYMYDSFLPALSVRSQMILQLCPEETLPNCVDEIYIIQLFITF